MKDIWFRLIEGLNRVNVLLGLRSKYFFELYLMIGPTLLLISALNSGQNIGVLVVGWAGGMAG